MSIEITRGSESKTKIIQDAIDLLSKAILNGDLVINVKNNLNQDIVLYVKEVSNRTVNLEILEPNTKMHIQCENVEKLTLLDSNIQLSIKIVLN